MKTYKDYCRPSSPVERTSKRPGDVALHSSVLPAERVTKAVGL